MGNMRVCVVDDDSAYVYLAKVIIRAIDSEIDIISFVDGDYALDFITEQMSDAMALPDIIFLDINMPRMDGWDFMEEYAKAAHYLPKKIPVYMLSSSISEQDIQRAMGIPLIADYIIKPLEQSQFATILEDFKNKNLR